MALKKRTYNSETRDAQASKTRTQILKSAKKLFQTHGFDKVTINTIADSADVASPTVYAIFKSKKGILQALIDEALSPEQFSSLVELSMSEKVPEKRLALTAKLARQMYDAEKEFMDVLREASIVAKGLEQEREKRRYERQGEYMKSLHKSLSKSLTLQEARDIVWTLTGRDLYRLLVIERGWSSDAYEKWLANTLIKSLLN